MLDALVGMAVRVLADERWIVDMIMVTVVVPMGMLVIRRLVDVIMAVPLRRMQVHTSSEPGCGECGEPRGAAVSERERECGADEGGHCEQRSCPRCTNRALSGEIQAKAHAVAGRTTAHQGSNRCEARRGSPRASAATDVSVAPSAPFAAIT
jgi:hypothetical protein